MSVAEGPNLNRRLTELSRMRSEAPIVSVYLDTRWTDEHQRERVRVVVREGIDHARAERPAAELDADLDWIAAQVDALVTQRRDPDAQGVALFASSRLGLREVIPVATPFEDAFVVDDRPYVRPLADVLEESPETLVVFVDGQNARLVPLGAGGVGEELELQSEVPGRHRRGGWALLAESRYRRHIEDHRGRHFEAVAEALQESTARGGVERIVLAGQPGNVADLRRHLPPALAGRIAGTIAGQQWEPAAALAARARVLLDVAEGDAEAAAVDEVLTEAAKGGRAVAGLAPTLKAVVRGAVHRLYLLRAFREPGLACAACGALRPGAAAACPLCGQPARAVELGEAMVERVVGTGGTVEMVERHAGLAERHGVAALLRYRP